MAFPESIVTFPKKRYRGAIDVDEWNSVYDIVVNAEGKVGVDGSSNTESFDHRLGDARTTVDSSVANAVFDYTFESGIRLQAAVFRVLDASVVYRVVSDQNGRALDSTDYAFRDSNTTLYIKSTYLWTFVKPLWGKVLYGEVSFWKELHIDLETYNNGLYIKLKRNGSAQSFDVNPNMSESIWILVVSYVAD